MTITVEMDFDKGNIENFSDLTNSVYQAAMDFGRKVIVQILETRDQELMESRDKRRYRCKGKQQTCIKTRLGAIEFKRNVYIDNSVAEGVHCVHLLDEDMDIEKVGLMSLDVCQAAAELACTVPYRDVARIITEEMGMPISAQGAWNIVQQLGEQRQDQVERQAELAKQHKGAGCIETKILYEENDGVWLKLQGKDRQGNGSSKEMKVGIAYDGATWEKGKDGKKRRTLDNKVAHAGFERAKEFRESKEGVVASRFDVSQIELRVINGDGALWIQKQKSIESISTLDKFHRNKKITECVKDREFAATVRTLLFENRIDDLLTCLAAQIDSTEDEDEKVGLRELLSYYADNKDALLGYYDRGREIPETREPGVVHHARLGSMESNIFTLIGNRMKGRRCCWSIKGANNLASLLCLKHTMGFASLFTGLTPLPNAQPDFVDTGKAISASKMPETEGKGCEFYNRATLPNISWLKNIASYQPLSTMRL